MDEKQIIYALRQRRRLLNITQKELGVLLGLSTTYVCQLERSTKGTSHSYTFYTRWAKALGLAIGLTITELEE